MNYAIPDGKDFILHPLNGETKKEPFSNIFSGLDKGAILRLMRPHGSGIQQCNDDDILLESKQALIQFSDDFTLFAIFFVDNQSMKLKIFQNLNN